MNDMNVFPLSTVYTRARARAAEYERKSHIIHSACPKGPQPVTLYAMRHTRARGSDCGSGHA